MPDIPASEYQKVVAWYAAEKTRAAALSEKLAAEQARSLEQYAQLVEARRLLEGNDMTAIMNAITLVLPWPDSDLSPNHRGNFWTKEKARKQAIKDGGNAVIVSREAGYYELPDRLQMTVTFHPTSRGRYDLDNALAKLKPALDGIFMALGRDDADITRVVLERGNPLKGGSVTVILGEVQA